MNLEHLVLPKSKGVLRAAGAYGENMKTRGCGRAGAPTHVSNDSGLQSVK